MIQQNKTVPETFSQKFREWWCKQFGHITSGPHYGMPQSHCRRCGCKTYHAVDTCKDWDEPWGPFFK